MHIWGKTPQMGLAQKVLVKVFISYILGVSVSIKLQMNGSRQFGGQAESCSIQALISLTRACSTDVIQKVKVRTAHFKYQM